jgi:hypothetical protein
VRISGLCSDRARLVEILHVGRKTAIAVTDIDMHRLLWLRQDIERRFLIDRETREWAEQNDREIEILRPDVPKRLEHVRDHIDERLDEIVAEHGLDRGPTYPGTSMLEQPPSGTASTTHSAQDPSTERAVARIARERLAVLLDEQTPHLLGALRGLGVAL